MCDYVPVPGLDVHKIFLSTPGNEADAGGSFKRS